MREKTATRVVATLVLLTWLSQIGYIILPLKNDSVNIAASGLQDLAEKNQASLKWMKERGEDNKIEPAELKKEVKQELWTFWFIQVGVILLGITAGLMAFFRFVYWRAAVVVTCVLYLAHWVSGHKAILSSVGLIQSYKLLWSMAAQFATTFDFFHRDVLLPILYIAIVIFIVWRSVRRDGLPHEAANR